MISDAVRAIVRQLGGQAERKTHTRVQPSRAQIIAGQTPVKAIYGTWNDIQPRGPSLNDLLVLSNDTSEHLPILHFHQV